jgi:hypothetical protein
MYNDFVPLGEPMLCAADNWRATSPVARDGGRS